MALIDSYRDAFAQLAATEEPGWLSQRRAAAFEAFADSGFPTRRHEEWKYTNLSPLGKSVFTSGRPTESPSELPTLDGVGATLVFRNGQLSAAESDTAKLPAGVAIRLGGEALDDLRSVRPIGEDCGIDALRDAFVSEVVAIDVTAGTSLDAPIHIVRIAEGDATPWMAAHQTVIRVARGAEVALVESFVGETDAPYFTNIATDANVDANGELRHYRIIGEGTEAVHVGRSSTRLERDARYRSFSFMTGGKTVRETLAVEVNGSGAHTDIASLYAPGSGQCHDSHTLIDHRAPGCTADQLYKGILHGKGHGIFNGKVFVQQVAQQTNANQLNQNLMLSRASRIDTKPQLEIFADDVRCTHGATVGQIEPEELFYMMSRAVPESVATRMIIAGFAEDVLERVSHSPTAARMRELLAAHLD